MTASIDIKNFQMDFGNHTVIRDLSFDVQQGETFGFLGGNGSGKTTTIRALLGIYQPTAGTLLVNGKVFTPEDGGSLGYLPEERGLYKKESVIDIMTYFGTLKGMDRVTARSWSLEYLKQVDLGDKATTKIDKLSGGQQQKVQLGVTIMNKPDLLILDEPTKGFDPVNRRLLMDIIERQRSDGATIMMVTHQMEEVEKLCDRVIMLKGGESVAYGTLAEVKDSFSKNLVVTIEFSGNLPTSKLYTIQNRNAHQATLQPVGDATGDQILRYLVNNAVELTSFRAAQASLDDIFIEVYGAEGHQEQPIEEKN